MTILLCSGWPAGGRAGGRTGEVQGNYRGAGTDLRGDVRLLDCALMQNILYRCVLVQNSPTETHEDQYGTLNISWALVNILYNPFSHIWQIFYTVDKFISAYQEVLCPMDSVCILVYISCMKATKKPCEWFIFIYLLMSRCYFTALIRVFMFIK